MAERLARHPDQVKQLFDSKAPTWSAKFADGRLTDRLTLFPAALGNYVPRGGYVLDLGCGTGELARATAAAGMRVTACDISPQMLRLGAALDPRGTVEWVQLDSNWRILPFRPATFDAVIAASVLEYVEQPSDVLGDCVRTLRPGGVIMFTVPNLAHPIRWLEWLLALSTRTPLAAKTARHWPRFEDYLTYLQISRQRHFARWWRATAEHYGLRMIVRPPADQRHSPLRMLSFRLPADAGED